MKSRFVILGPKNILLAVSAPFSPEICLAGSVKGLTYSDPESAAHEKWDDIN